MSYLRAWLTFTVSLATIFAMSAIIYYSTGKLVSQYPNLALLPLLVFGFSLWGLTRLQHFTLSVWRTAAVMIVALIPTSIIAIIMSSIAAVQLGPNPDTQVYDLMFGAVWLIYTLCGALLVRRWAKDQS